MIAKTRRRIYAVIELLVVLVILTYWWFWVADWSIVPGTYRITSIYIGAVLVAGGLNYRALVRFHRVVKQVHREEVLGNAPEGFSLFAENQRFRYLMRVIESSVVLVVGVVGFYAVKHPQVMLNRWYGRLVITYFVGSILVTGYLTARDIIVLNRVKKLGATDYPQDADATAESNGIKIERNLGGSDQ